MVSIDHMASRFLNIPDCLRFFMIIPTAKSCSKAVALVGGGTNPKPGEVSRARYSVDYPADSPVIARHIAEVVGYRSIDRVSRGTTFG